MDDKKALLEQIREGLKNYGSIDPCYGAVPPEDFYKITMPDDDMTTISSGGVTNITGADGYNYPNVTIASGHTWTGTNVYISPNTWSTIDDITIGNRQSGKITLQGDEADIDINGRSLMKTLDAIQERLAMLVPDAEMEAEWDDLRVIREQYEAKLQECREKSRVWKALKDMPPPKV